MQSDLTSIFLPSARWLSSSDLYTLAAHACQSAQTFLLSTAYATQMHQHAETIVKIMNCDRGLLLPVFHPTFRHMTCTCVSEHGHATKEASASRALSCSQTRRARTCCDVSSAAPGPSAAPEAASKGTMMRTKVSKLTGLSNTSAKSEGGGGLPAYIVVLSFLRSAMPMLIEQRTSRSAMLIEPESHGVKLHIGAGCGSFCCLPADQSSS